MVVNQLNLFGEVIEKKEKRGKVKTIISASRRTDIPAFFYDWLQAALAEGLVEIPNPMFPDRKYVVDLKPESVHSIVLWSKNFINVLKDPRHLEDYNLYFQYTINNYSRLLEPNVAEYKETMRILDGLLQKYKPQQFNIRFDPVIISTKGETSPTPNIPEKARLRAFEQLCRDLKAIGMDNCRITTSYLAMYGHVKTMLDRIGLDNLFMNEENQLLFFGKMVETAGKYGFCIYSCASPLLEGVKGIKQGRCIDGELLCSLFGGFVKKAKDKGQRATCGCSCSKDIGIYSRNENGMKCRHNCAYCYVKENTP